MDRFRINEPLPELEKECWVMSKKDGYMRFMTQDAGDIAVTVWNHQTVGAHCHEFYELALINQGSCIHMYQGTEKVLIAGDLLLIAPDEIHSYMTKMPIEIINCQFYGNGLEGDVIHLEGEEKEEIKGLLEKMMKEQRRRETGYEKIKELCLQMIMVVFQRKQNQRNQETICDRDQRSEQINRVIQYMEEHLEEKMDLNMLAKKCYWSAGHFRLMFKEITGISPLEYLNRLRVVKSIEYIEKEGMLISRAAERVGIYDASYYSRLFKKMIGYSPRQLKNKIVK